MKIKIQTVGHYKSVFILPTIGISWDWDIFTISFTWLKWSIDIDFLKKQNNKNESNIGI
jgi:hypothetical protein